MPPITTRNGTLLGMALIIFLTLGLVGTVTLAQAGAFRNTNGNQTGTWAGMMPNGSGMMDNRSWAALDAVTPVATQTVTMTNQDAFGPQVIHVISGTTVTWTNRDTDAHTLTFMAGMMHSVVVASGDQFHLTFTTVGTYDYLCLYHQGMLGRVIVTTA